MKPTIKLLACHLLMLLARLKSILIFGCIKKYVKDKKSLPSDKEGLNEDNIDFFVCRDCYYVLYQKDSYFWHISYQ